MAATTRPLSPHLTHLALGTAHARLDPPPRDRRRPCRSPASRVLTWWLLAIAERRRCLCELRQGGRAPGRAGRPDRPDLGFFQHLLSGIRHLVMDTGAGFELGINKRFAILTIVGSVLLTALAVGLSAGSAAMSLGDSATPLGKVRGLGSARDGGEHWLTERVTSIALAAARHLADRLAAAPARRSTSARSSNGCTRRAARCRWRC